MIKTLFNLLIVLYPILSAYASIGGLDLGGLLVFLAGVICCIINPSKFIVKFPQGYGVFLIFTLLSTLIFTEKIQLWLIMFSINMLFALSYGDIKLILKFYKYSVIVCSAFFVIQQGLFVTTGKRISGFIPFLPLIYGDDSIGYIQEVLSAERSSAFFLEPSYLAQYLFLYLIVVLFLETNRNLLKAIIVSIVLLLVDSGAGLFLLGVIWVFYLAKSDYAKRKRLLAFIALCTFILIVFIIDSELFAGLLSRSDELSLNVQAGEWYNSGFIRVYRGYYLFADLPLINKLFGTPMDILETVRKANPYYFYEKNTNFLNGIQMLMIYYGVFSCLLYLRHLLLFVRDNKDNFLVVTLICVFLLMFTESYFMTSRMFLVLVVMQLYKEYKNNNENTIYHK